MARTMSIDNTDIYRAVVDEMYPEDPIGAAATTQTTAYGPHDASNQAKDQRGSHWHDNPTRVRKQKLGITQTLRGECVLGWQTIKTTYTNGGEDVQWDG